MINAFKRVIKNVGFQFKCNHVSVALNSDISHATVFEGQNKVGEKTYFDGAIGYGSYIGKNCTIKKTKIGRFCSIGDGVSALSSSHPSSVFVSTCPMFYSLMKQNGETFVDKQKYSENSYVDENLSYSCIIGNDVWIGSGAIIIAGVSIGDGAIIGAGSIVTHDVEPYAIVVGVPAKTIKYRFTTNEIEWLKKFQWWNKSIEWIKKNADKFENIENFIKAFS